MTTQNEQRAEQLAADIEQTIGELDQIESRYGSDRSTMPAGQAERAERLTRHLKLAKDEMDLLSSRAERMERLRAAASDVRNREGGFGGSNGFDETRTKNPWVNLDQDAMRSESLAGFATRAHDAIEYTAGLPQAFRNRLAEMVDREGGTAGAAVVTLSSPHYRTAFEKILRSPERALWTMTPAERDAVAAEEAMRAGLDTTTGTGGYLIPLSLAPDVVIANAGAANPFRALCDVRQTATSPYRAPVTTGITASWKAEGAAFPDATPTFTKVDVNLYAESAYAFASYEILDDSAVANDLPALFRDARDRLEATGFSVGTGTAQPTGVVTSVGAVTASRVSPTTGGSFSSASILDVHKVWNNLPPRAR
jgi:hypothetical protein